MGLLDTESKITNINMGSPNFHYVVVPAIFYTADLRQNNPNFTTVHIWSPEYFIAYRMKGANA